jgi:formylglycine-generating enzyme required for sulfatase activity
LGLFDTLGNVLEWCQDAALLYSQNRAWMDDQEQAGAVRDSDLRVLRGGAFDAYSSNVRSAIRYTFRPSYRSVIYGFRVARTYP